MVSIPDELASFVKIKHTTCTSKNIKFDISTYTVIPTNTNGEIKKHGNYILDDNTYIKYPQLIKLVPRGFSILYHNNIEICRLDGLEKFDGSIFNKNAIDINTWTNFKVEFFEKANGKMAIFKLFEFNNIQFIFGGSKNVHIVVGIDEKIEDSLLHHNILKEFQKDIIHNFNYNETIIGEYVDGQHIVCVNKPSLVYFSGPVITVKKILPDQNTIPTTDQLNYLRSIENTEGVVIVYTNTDTGVVFRQKHKSIWYILIRVMREGLKHYNKNISTNTIVSNVYNIFIKRSDDFLKLSETDLSKWADILYKFVLFIKQKEYEFSDLDMQKLGIGIIFDEFSKVKDNIKEEGKEEWKEEETEEKKEINIYDQLNIPSYGEYLEKLYTMNIKFCVIMRGLTGSGKSTLAKNLTSLYNTQVFSTDDLFTVDGKYNFNHDKLKEFHDKNYSNFKEAIDNKVLSVCVDNTNITFHEYHKYIEYAKNNGYVTVVLDFKQFDSNILVSRSVHGVPLTNIISKNKIYKFTKPAYYGIFFNNEIINKYSPKQKTPFHITIFHKTDYIGKEFTIKVDSICTNKAGRYLSIEDLHITLETFDGYKPVDVGKYLPEITTKLELELKGVFGPIY